MFDIIYNLMLDLIQMLTWLIPMYLIIRILLHILFRGVR